MKPRIILPLLGVGALVIGTGVVVHVASAAERPTLVARYTETGSWAGGLIGAFTISNPSDGAATDWKLSFGLPGDAKVAGVWNATVSAANGGYTVRPTAETKTVAPHGSVVVGFTALTSAPTTPVKCLIDGKNCKIDLGAVAHLDASVTDQSGSDQPDTDTPGGVVGVAPDRPAAPAQKPAGRAPETPPVTTEFAPVVSVPAGDRPPLKALAAGSGATLLTLAGAVPSINGGCELTWGGTTALTAHAKEVTDALHAGIRLVVSVGATAGVDLAQACGTVSALVAQLKKIVDLGVRSIDFTIDSGLVANLGLNTLRAQAVTALKAAVPGLTVSYTLGTALGALDSLTAPLAAAHAVGAVIDRVNLLPVQLTSLLGTVQSLLGGIGIGDTVDELLVAAGAVHQKIMAIQGVDAAAAWHALGIVPVIGKELLGGVVPLDTVRKLVGFAKANGLGLLGLLPVAAAGDVCASGGGGGLPLLSCLDSTVLPHFLAITDIVNRTLR